MRRWVHVVWVWAGLWTCVWGPVGAFAQGSTPVSSSVVVSAPKLPSYKHPSFIVGVSFLVVGALLTVPAVVLSSYDGTPVTPANPCERREDKMYCMVHDMTIGVGLFSGAAAGMLAAGTSSMIYWGVNIHHR